MKPTFKQFADDEVKKADVVMDIIMRDCKKWLTETNCFPVYRGMLNDRDDDSIRTLLRYSKEIDNKPNIDISRMLLKFEVNKHREPIDSPRWLHDMLDKKLVTETGIPFRSKSVFAVPNIDIAYNYGKPFSIFPIGDYDYAWSPKLKDAMHDLYGWLATETYEQRSWTHVVEENGPIGEMFQNAWKKYLKNNSYLKARGANEKFESFKNVAIQNYFNNGYVKDEIIQQVIADNSFWEFNTGLLSAITSHQNHDHEIMIATDFYYAVPNTAISESTLVKELRRKLQNA